MRAHVWYRVPRWLLPTLRTMPPFDEMARCEQPEYDAPIDATRHDVTPVGASAEAASRDALLHLEAACLSVETGDAESVVWIKSTIDAQGNVTECSELFARAPAEVLRNPEPEVEPERCGGEPSRAEGTVSIEEALALEARVFQSQSFSASVLEWEGGAAPPEVGRDPPAEVGRDPPPPPPPPPPPNLSGDAPGGEAPEDAAPRTFVRREGEAVLALESHLTPRCLRLLATNRTSWPTAEKGRFVALATNGLAVQIGNALVDAGSYTAEGVDACYEWKGSARAKRAPAGGPRGRVMRLVREKSRRRERR